MTRRLQCQTPSGEQSQASERRAPPAHSVPGARAYRHCTLRGPGPQIQEVGVTIAICAQTGERPHRAYTLAPPLLPSKGRTHIRMPPDITPAAATDLPAILELLAASKLPRASIEAHVASTLVARDHSGIVGSAALELARRRGVRTVYLLTETAGQFFPKFGFTAITRAQVESAVLESPEFTTACPKSAIAMVKQL